MAISRRAWVWRMRLDKAGRTVLRAGAGLYYDSSVSLANDVINSGPLNGASLSSTGSSLFGPAISLTGTPPISSCPR